MKRYMRQMLKIFLYYENILESNNILIRYVYIYILRKIKWIKKLIIDIFAKNKLHMIEKYKCRKLFNADNKFLF